MKDFNELYIELEEICKELRIYYDIDKIKPYSVYVFEKDGNVNVFDIQADKIVFYEDVVVIKESLDIIERIQLKLMEIELFYY